MSVKRRASSRGESVGSSSEPDDPRAHHVRNAVPDATRPGRAIAQGFGAAALIEIAPAVKCGPRDAELFQRALDRQGRLLDQPDDLGFLGCGVSHASYSPSVIMLFLSRRFSMVS